MTRPLTPTTGILAAATALLLLAGCAPAPTTPAAKPTSTFCARMVTNSGGLNDRSFNQSSWEGLQRAEKELGISARVLVSNSATDLEPNVQQAVESNCGF